MIKIVGIALSGSVAALILKETKPAFSLCVSIVTATVIFYMIVRDITYVFDLIGMLSARLELNTDYIGTILRIIGIAYITHFGSALCEDAGHKMIAQNIELAGKLLIVVSSIPIITAILNLLIGILPTS